MLDVKLKFGSQRIGKTAYRIYQCELALQVSNRRATRRVEGLFQQTTIFEITDFPWKIDPEKVTLELVISSQKLPV